MANAGRSSRTTLGLAAATAVLALAAFWVAEAAPSTRTLPRELRLVRTDVGPGGGWDVPPSGASVGDSDTFTGIVSDPRTHARRGRAETACTIFDHPAEPPRNTIFHCSEVLRLGDGQVILFGRISFDKTGNERHEPLAIVGGTRHYADARGEASSRPLSRAKTLIVLHFHH